MKTWTLAALHQAAEIGGLCVVEVTVAQLRRDDVIFWDSRWRTVDSTSVYQMKDNRKVFMTATGYHGQTFIKR
ncbi:UNVERIFIED_CONTAM: hypothetical protein RF648_20540, partial [Kocuria sp. CPCC 205274]